MYMTPPTLLFAGGSLTSTRPARIRLRRRGARILLADTPEEALRRAVENRPEVVVFDEDGRGDWPGDWLERLRAQRPDVDLVILESPGSAGPRSVGLGVLFSGAKPVSTSMLVDILSVRFRGRLTEEDESPAPRVLCVDDDPRWLKTLQRTLSRRGYEVLPCGSADAAVEALRAGMPDAALVDIMMPGKDGLDLTEEIAQATRGRVPVVLLTALDSDEAWHEGHRRGAKYFVTKTSDPDRIADVVDYLAADLDEPERALIRSHL